MISQITSSAYKCMDRYTLPSPNCQVTNLYWKVVLAMNLVANLDSETVRNI